MNLKEEKMIIQYLLGSTDVFSRCIAIIEPSYFHNSFTSIVSFIKDYYNKYNTIVSVDVLHAKFDEKFVVKEVTKGEYKFACDTIELFCRQQAVSNAVIESMPEVEKGNIGILYDRIVKATTIGLSVDLGFDVFKDAEKIFNNLTNSAKPYTTGIKALDDRIAGGGYRKQLTLFSANSGGGKSVVLTNLGVNYALQGLSVLYLSLELPEDQIFLRAASMISGVAIKTWRDSIPQYISSLIKSRNEGAGDFTIKRIKGDACTNDIRSYIKQYELEHKKVPDVLIVDYVDKMTPNGGKKQMSISEQDKEKTEQLAELVFDLDMIGFSASQQNREAIGNGAPTQGVIAGGLTKVNTVDNYISIYMPEDMKLKGEMLFFFLKTRYSDGVGEQALLKYNVSTLKITDLSGPMTLKSSLKDRKRQIEELMYDGLVDSENVEYAENNPLVKEVLFSDKKNDTLDLDEDIPTFKSILDDAFGIVDLVKL